MTSRRLAGESVSANCLHPGLVDTRFADGAGGWTRWAFSLVKRFAISSERGADTIVYLASSPDSATASGEYFAKRKTVACSDAAREMDAARQLWEISEELMTSV